MVHLIGNDGGAGRQSEEKMQKAYFDQQLSVSALQDNITVRTSYELLDKTKGANICQRGNVESNHISFILDHFHCLIDLHSLDEQVKFLDRCLKGTRFNQIITTFFDRYSCQLYDSVLSKFSASLFSRLPATNPFSSSS